MKLDPAPRVQREGEDAKAEGLAARGLGRFGAVECSDRSGVVAGGEEPDAEVQLVVGPAAHLGRRVGHDALLVRVAAQQPTRGGDEIRLAEDAVHVADARLLGVARAPEIEVEYALPLEVRERRVAQTPGPETRHPRAVAEALARLFRVQQLEAREGVGERLARVLVEGGLCQIDQL